MIKRLPFILLALIALGAWLLKVNNVIETEQHNDRAVVNNSIVRVLEELRDEVTGSQPFLLQFAQLDQLDESQQRGMWFLLEDMEFDHQADIESARAELQAIASEGDEEEARYVAAAENFLDIYSGHAAVYTELADTIRSKTLGDEELMALIMSEFDVLDMAENEAIDVFDLARLQYMDGG